MVELNIFDYYKAKDVIWAYEKGGIEGLPFSI